MLVDFFTSSKNSLWKDMEHKICKSIVDNNCGTLTPKYRIHFDKMLFSIGWFKGFVEIWKGKTPNEKNRRRIRFVAHIVDWGNYSDIRKRQNYSMI